METKGKWVSPYLYQKIIDFKPKMVTRHKEGHYIAIKGSIHQENIIIVNTYTLNIKALKYIKQILMDLKEEINSNVIIVRTLIPHW